MTPLDYVSVFDFATESPPSVLPLVGTVVVAAMGLAIMVFGKLLHARIIAGVFASAIAFVGFSDYVKSNEDYERIRVAVERASQSTVVGIFAVVDSTDGSFAVGDRHFNRPTRRASGFVFHLTRDARRLDGKCVRASFTDRDEITSLDVVSNYGSTHCGGQ